MCKTGLVEDCQEDGGTSCTVTREQECSVEEVEECVNTVVECEDICTTVETEECVMKKRQVGNYILYSSFCPPDSCDGLGLCSCHRDGVHNYAGAGVSGGYSECL